MVTDMEDVLGTSVPLVGAEVSHLLIDGQTPAGLRQVEPRFLDRRRRARRRVQTYGTTHRPVEDWLRPDRFPKLRTLEVRLDGLAPQMNHAILSGPRPASRPLRHIGPDRAQWGAVWSLVRDHPGVQELLVRGRDGFGWQGWEDAPTALEDAHNMQAFGDILNRSPTMDWQQLRALRTVVLDIRLNSERRWLPTFLVHCGRYGLPNLSLPAMNLFDVMGNTDCCVVDDEGREVNLSMVPEVTDTLRLTGDVYRRDHHILPDDHTPIGDIFAHLAYRRDGGVASHPTGLNMRALHVDACLLLSFVVNFVGVPHDNLRWQRSLPVPSTTGRGVPFRLEISMDRDAIRQAVYRQGTASESGSEPSEDAGDMPDEPVDGSGTPTPTTGDAMHSITEHEEEEAEEGEEEEGDLERDAYRRFVELLRPGKPGHLGVLLRFHRDAPPFHTTRSQHQATRSPVPLGNIVHCLSMLHTAGLFSHRDVVPPVCVHVRLDDHLVRHLNAVVPSDTVDLAGAAELLDIILSGSGLLGCLYDRTGCAGCHGPRWSLVLDGGGHARWGPGSRGDHEPWVRALAARLGHHIDDKLYVQENLATDIRAWFHAGYIQVLPDHVGEEDAHGEMRVWLHRAMAEDTAAATSVLGPTPAPAPL